MIAMPERVKKNPLLRDLWELPHKQDMNCTLIIVGKPGSGKSALGLKFCKELDPSFNLERVAFDGEDFWKLIDDGDSNGKLKPGQAVLFDEAGGSETAADSRNSLTTANKLMSYFATTTRAMRLIVVYVIPTLNQLDKRLRSVGSTGVILTGGINRLEKLNYAKFYWTITNPITSKVLMPIPQIKKIDGSKFRARRLIVPLIDDVELLEEYKKKKMDFIVRKVHDWRKKVFEKPQVKRKINLASYFDKALGVPEDLKDSSGKFSVSVIRAKFGLSEKHAKHLRTALKAHFSARQTGKASNTLL